MMLAPWSTAQRMPSAMPAAEPEPLASSTLTGMIVHAAQVPATPMPLSARAAMTPATIVRGRASRGRVRAAVEGVVARDERALEIGLRWVDAAVHDRDDDAVRGVRELPRLRRVHLGETPLARPGRVVGRLDGVGGGGRRRSRRRRAGGRLHRVRRLRLGEAVQERAAGVGAGDPPCCTNSRGVACRAEVTALECRELVAVRGAAAAARVVRCCGRGFAIAAGRTVTPGDSWRPAD